MEPGYEMCVSPCVYGNEEVRKEILAECFVRELLYRDILRNSKVLVCS